MGHTIWVDVQGRAENECPPDNSTMLKMEGPLDRLSEKLRVRKLSEFYDYSIVEGELFRPLAMFLGWIRDVLGARDISKEYWFDPGPALSAVQAVRSHHSQHPTDLGIKAVSSQLPDYLMKELQHCETVLTEAASRGRKFRFLIVP
jgi:hypothetical protein